MAEYLDVIENVEAVENNERPPRIIKDRLNPMEVYNDEVFLNRFRFPKAVVLELLHEIEQNHLLADLLGRKISISPINKLLLTLHFYGTGCFLRTNSDIFGIHKSNTSRIIAKCSRAIASLYDKYITFPTGNEIQNVKRKFYEIGGMPGIIGAIDCTHIAILSPGGDQAELFRNRKGYFSINVQMIGDANLIIRNVVARWPGSTHDARIFDNSEICFRFENASIDGILLGDNGYALRKYLLTPFLAPRNHAERRYNYVQSKTRIKIENLFGVLKRRFPCLGYKLRLKLETSLIVIVACSVLHNLARQRNLPDIDEGVINDGRNEHVPVQNAEGDNVSGIAQRNRMVQILQDP